MKQLKKTINSFFFISLVLLAILFWNTGCNTPPPDPLAGWKILSSRDSEKLSQSIKDDYPDYIKKLPARKRELVDIIWFFEDRTGQHAVKFDIPLNGVWFSHVLIYDKENKRIKVIKYRSGTYRS